MTLFRRLSAFLLRIAGGSKDFAWDSDEQRQGYLAFVKWAKDKGVPAEILPVDLFFIQKDHDSHVYWGEMVGNQIKSLEDQIRLLHEEVKRRDTVIGEIYEAMKTEKMVYDYVVRALDEAFSRIEDLE